MSSSQKLAASQTDTRNSNNNNLNAYRNQNQKIHENNSRYHHHQQQQQQWQQQYQWQRQYQQRQQHEQQRQQQQQVVVVKNNDRNDLNYPNVAFPLPSLSRMENKITNLDSFRRSLTPIVRARRLHAKVNLNEQVNGEDGSCPFFYIGDLWESFTEWSAYGVGVPLVLSDEFRTTQYYCPSLSGIQIYVKHVQEETKAGFIDEEADVKSRGTYNEIKYISNGSSSSYTSCELSNLTKQPSDFKNEGSIRSSGALDFQFFESIAPYLRKPLYVQASELAPKFPQLSTYRSCDLLPTSWVAVLWFPIYRVPMGPMQKGIDASFLTIHSLSTQPGSINEAEFSKRNIGGVPNEIDLRLPIIGLANYKLHSSIIAPTDHRECLQEKLWFEATTNWLHDVEALHLPDHKFFHSRRFSRPLGARVRSDAKFEYQYPTLSYPNSQHQ